MLDKDLPKLATIREALETLHGMALGCHSSRLQRLANDALRELEKLNPLRKE